MNSTVAETGASAPPPSPVSAAGPFPCCVSAPFSWCASCLASTLSPERDFFFRFLFFFASREEEEEEDEDDDDDEEEEEEEEESLLLLLLLDDDEDELDEDDESESESESESLLLLLDDELELLSRLPRFPLPLALPSICAFLASYSALRSGGSSPVKSANFCRTFGFFSCCVRLGLETYTLAVGSVQHSYVHLPNLRHRWHWGGLPPAPPPDPPLLGARLMNMSLWTPAAGRGI